MIEEKKIRAIAVQAIQCLNENHIWGMRRARYAQYLTSNMSVLFDQSISYQKSACIIHTPFQIGEKYEFDRITLQLGLHTDTIYQSYIVFHELAHMLSIGELRCMDESTFLRPWGVCTTTYSIKNGRVFSAVDKTHYEKNEKLNDCLACFLFERIQGERLRDQIMKKRGEYAVADQKEILRYYLNHQLPQF